VNETTRPKSKGKKNRRKKAIKKSESDSRGEKKISRKNMINTKKKQTERAKAEKQVKSLKRDR